MVMIIIAIILALFGIGRIASGYCAGSGAGMMVMAFALVLDGCGVINMLL